MEYVDDTTVSETIPKGQPSRVQQAVDQVNTWSKKNLLQLNCDKTKELVISFNHPHSPQFLTCFIEGDPIARTTSAKLLGLMINDKLTWKIM